MHHRHPGVDRKIPKRIIQIKKKVVVVSHQKPPLTPPKGENFGFPFPFILVFEKLFKLIIGFVAQFI
jgi:hypothetical protein